MAWARRAQAKTDGKVKNRSEARRGLIRLLGLVLAIISGLGLGSLAGKGNAQSQPTAGEPAYSARARIEPPAFTSVRSTDSSKPSRSGAAEVGAVLESLPGVVVQRTASGSASPVIRGLTGNRVLVVLDDMRLNDALTRAGGHALLQLIDPESVAQVEVVRGPASVLYGSDALGGVVRVTSKRPRPSPQGAPRLGAAAALRLRSATSHGRVQGSVWAGVGRLAARISGGLGHTGHTLRGGDHGRQPFTGHDHWSLASHLESRLSAQQHLSLAQQSGHLLNMPRSDVSTPDDVRITRRLDRNGSQLNYSGRWPGRTLTVQAYAGFALRREWRRRIRPMRLEDERDTVMSYQVGAGARVRPWRGATLTTGLRAALDRVASNSVTTEGDHVSRSSARGRYVDNSAYDLFAAYALVTQSLFETPLLLLVGGRANLVRVRAPADPLFANTSSPPEATRRSLLGPVASIGIRADVTPELALLANVLSGFRAPNLEDFQAFGGGARGLTIPNPNLGVERSWTLDAGTKFRTGDLQLQAFIWASWLSGLIVRVPAKLRGMSEIGGDPVLQRTNAQHSLLLGCELMVQHRLSSGVYGGLATWASYGRSQRPDSQGQLITEPADKMPPPQGRVWLGFEKQMPRHWLELQLAGQLPQRRLSAADRLDARLCTTGRQDCKRVPGYAELSLRAGLELRPHIQVLLTLENILDTDYKTYASGAFAPGRSILLSLRIQSEAEPRGNR